MKRVLVGAPISDFHAYCTKEYAEGLKKLTYPDKEIFLVDNSEEGQFHKKVKELVQGQVKRSPARGKSVKERIVESRNEIREAVLLDKYDYFLSLEQDVIPPPDVIQRLLQHKKDIVSGVYFTEASNRLIGKKYIPLLYRWPTEEEKRNAKENFEKIKGGLDKEMIAYLKKNDYDISNLDMPMDAEEVRGNKLLQIKMCGLGCVLIHHKVLEKVFFRQKERNKAFDDYFFCLDARKAGFEIFVDTSMKCKHLIKQRSWQWKDLLEQKKV